MNFLKRTLGWCNLWGRTSWMMGVDDTDKVVRWVSLKKGRDGALAWVGAGQWEEGAPCPWSVDDGVASSVALAIKTPVTILRHVSMLTPLDESDHPTWAKAQTAQALDVHLSSLSVDWGREMPGESQHPFWLAGVQASSVASRERWAHEHGAALRVIDAQSLALERVLIQALHNQTDPIWLWWAGPDEGHLCTGWWHLGRWYERQTVPVDLHRLETMPGVLLNLVRTTKVNKPSLGRPQWWWSGRALQPWVDRWMTQVTAGEAEWACQPAPVPFASDIELATHQPAHLFSMALGLALHPGLQG